ncbi:YbhB/YbcL family Raf kinase inhibitor-like protein [uncultured Sphingomonas sp.]|uniref:YbhB/YbcL family Raf kinase inhibitor-like protein n=1 Tax=uncultured Sphingomonas sp. TaxID=158754 RepID=UPI0025D362F8|nr:YbhB/YbcL family Raf kinase inhibitor-like protein [uncultured Sphingomonas sp.]
MAFQVSSPSFSDQGDMPAIHAREHGNVLPALDWGGAPVGTEGYAVIVQDPDAPAGTVTHLAVCDIGAEHPGLAEGQDLSRYTLCANVFGEQAYGGPRPPAGHGPHHYHFKVFALDVPTLDVVTGDDPRALLRAMDGHVVAEAEIVGIFENKGE